MEKLKKQFIAGATCPQCASEDTIVLYTNDQRIECICCDFKKSSTQRDFASGRTKIQSVQKSDFTNTEMINVTVLKK